MTRVVEINSLEQLAGLRLLWNLLLSQTREATYFQTLDWLESYWLHHGQRQQLRVLIVFSGDRPIGILPLTVLHESTRLGTLRVLTYPLDGWGTFFGPIGPNPTATLCGALRHVQEALRDWDLCDLRWVDVQGIDAGRTNAALHSTELLGTRKPWAEAAQIELTGDWDTYWLSRKPDWRREVERCRRRLAEQGELNYVRYRPEGSSHGDDDPRWDLYDVCEELARRSWQGSSTDGTTLSHASVRDYLRDAHRTAAEAGGVDLNLLLLGGRPAAFAYNYHYRGNVYGLRAGYDQNVAAGAGTVLLRQMAEDSCRRGDYRIDLGPDSLDYKRPWATRIQTSSHYPYYAPEKLKAQAVRAKRWLTGSRF
jgi:CelD/BcsL family acetyltransferase involved in cellulose biosynthesis